MVPAGITVVPQIHSIRGVQHCQVGLDRELGHPTPKKPCADRARNSVARVAAQIRTGHWRSAVFLLRTAASVGRASALQKSGYLHWEACLLRFLELSGRWYMRWMRRKAAYYHFFSLFSLCFVQGSHTPSSAHSAPIRWVSVLLASTQGKLGMVFY
jgi:hypothetical protein